MAKKKVAANQALNDVLANIGNSGMTDGVATKFMSAHDNQVQQREEEPAAKTDSIETQKSNKKPFSFRADPIDVLVWKAYAQTAGRKIEDLCSEAINEYIANHELQGTQGTIFELKKTEIFK